MYWLQQLSFSHAPFSPIQKKLLNIPLIWYAGWKWTGQMLTHGNTRGVNIISTIITASNHSKWILKNFSVTNVLTLMIQSLKNKDHTFQWNVFPLLMWQKIMSIRLEKRLLSFNLFAIEGFIFTLCVNPLIFY